MDYTVTWSPEALDDVDTIAEYIARDSRFYAGAVVDKIIETSRKLKDFPKAGRVVPELGDNNLREPLSTAIALSTGLVTIRSLSSPSSTASDCSNP